MKKRLLTIELKILSGQETSATILAFVDKIDKLRDSEVFHVIIFQNEKIIFDESYVSSRLELIKFKVLDELRSKIDSLDPLINSIEIIEDSHELLNKISLRCPKCKRKLYESWGKVKGIVIKCHRCGKVAVPVIQ